MPFERVTICSMAAKPVLLRDVFGATVRLTDERRAHVLEHPEMVEFAEALSEALALPERVVQSRSDPAVKLFYVRRTSTIFGGEMAVHSRKIFHE